MSMIHEGVNQFEDAGPEFYKVIDKVIAEHGNRILRVGRWALVRDQIFATMRTPAPKKPKADKVKKRKTPLRPGAEPGGDPSKLDAPDVETEQAEPPARKPPHLVVLRWTRPPAAVQVHLQKKK